MYFKTYQVGAHLIHSQQYFPAEQDGLLIASIEKGFLGHERKVNRKNQNKFLDL